MIHRLIAFSTMAFLLTFALTGCESDEPAAIEDLEPTTNEAYDETMEANITDPDENPDD